MAKFWVVVIVIVPTLLDAIDIFIYLFYYPFVCLFVRIVTYKVVKGLG